MSAPDAPAVIVRNLSRDFGGTPVLREIDLTIPFGQFVALLGRSGSGKTTLLRSLAGLDSEAQGEVRVPGQRSIMFQEPRLIPSERVWRNVLLGVPVRANRERALQLLDEVGLRDRARAWPGVLSGGEAQRVALARALVQEPGLLLLDEPFAALDALTRLTAQALVRTLTEAHGPATLLVTHDVDEAITLADRILVLTDGRISLDTTVEDPRVHDRSSPAFASLRQRLLEELGVSTSRIS